MNRRSTALDILRTSCRKIASILTYSCGPLSQPLGLSELRFAGIRQSQRYARAETQWKSSTQSDTFSAAAAVDCRGAWSGAPVRPRKGQMLYVLPQASLLQHVLRTPEVYVVPRSSGKILIGATVEDVGFDKSVDPSAIQQLVTAASKYLPELASAPITQSWAGLRPGTPDDLPIIGPTNIPRVFAATGHFRNGILLAPVTAQIMADLIQESPLPYGYQRLLAGPVSCQTELGCDRKHAF